MAEVKYNQSHHAGATPEARIANRLRNSGVGSGTNPDTIVQNGNSPNRTFTNIHNSPSKQRDGGDDGGRR